MTTIASYRELLQARFGGRLTAGKHAAGSACCAPPSASGASSGMASWAYS